VLGSLAVLLDVRNLPIRIGYGSLETVYAAARSAGLNSCGKDNYMTTKKKKIGVRLLAMLRHRCSGSVHSIAATMAEVIFLVLMSASLISYQAHAVDDVTQLFNSSRSLYAQEGSAAPSATESESAAANHLKRANFEQERASHEARHVADWVVDSGDNLRMPFVIVDKTNAKVFVFNPDGRLHGAASALLGLALGDEAVPGIGKRKLSSIRPEERTTPAGRFVAALGRNLYGKEILWVDYDGAISLHPVVTANLKERRLERLATSTTHDKRISYGCINVPAKFFQNVVRPAFTGTNGIVYVLPETRTAREVFTSYDVEERTPPETASQTVPAQVPSGTAWH